MRGVDWRQRVINNVGESNFHDIQDMKLDHIQMARFIKMVYKNELKVLRNLSLIRVVLSI